MTREEFEAWVRRLEEYAHREPASYRRRVAMLTFLGWSLGYLLLLVSVLLAGTIVWLFVRGGFGSLAGGIGVLVLAPVLAGAISAVSWKVRMRAVPPEGLQLERNYAPALFDVIEKVREQAAAPRVHQVLLDTGLTAGICQAPKLGFGPSRNTLFIGLPLLQALSPEQFLAVLAHEMAHLSRRHGRMGRWVHRVHGAMARVMIDIERQRGPAAGLLRPFLRWYVPRLNVYSFVLRRQDEYDADQLSGEVAGRRSAAEALIMLHLAEGFLDAHFWPSVQDLAKEAEYPPDGIFTVMGRLLSHAPTSPDIRKWIRQSLVVETNVADSHPCLADRLGMLGYLARTQSAVERAWSALPPRPLKVSAAEHFLGRTLDALTQTLERVWQRNVAKNWRQRFVNVAKARKRLQALTRLAHTRVLDPPDAVEQCLLAEGLVGAKAAIPLARNLATQFPRLLEPQFLLGRLLLRENDVSGVAYVEAVIKQDPSMVRAGCEAMYDYYMNVGKAEAAADCMRRAEQHYAAARGAERERDGMNASDAFVPHEMGGEWVMHLRERMEEVQDILEAFLVRKSVRHFTDRPMYVLLIVCRKKRWYTEDAFEALRDKLRTFPQHMLILKPIDCPGDTAQAIRAVPGSRIFKRRGEDAVRK